MGLKKGMTNNPNGRKAGVPNKVTTGMRERINAFLEDNFDLIQEDFKVIHPTDRLTFYTKLLSFGLPSLRAVEHSGEIKTKLDSLTDEQLTELVNEVINKTNEPHE